MTEKFEGTQRPAPRFKQGTLVKECIFGSEFPVTTCFLAKNGTGVWYYNHPRGGCVAERDLKNVTRTSLPTDAKERKDVPLWSGLLKYFPDALVAVARLSKAGNDQHNPGEPLHWARGKSMDQEDCLMRHLLEAGTVDVDGQLHSTKVAWRALAMLQLELEARKETHEEPFCNACSGSHSLSDPDRPDSSTFVG